MRILVVNPNTSASMTEKIGAAARAVAASGTIITAANPSMGPVSIEGFYDEAFSVPGLLEVIRDGKREGYDAYVIACFDDTGLDAARSLAREPVIGICEAGVHCATMISNRFSIVTTLQRSVPPIEALLERYGAARRCRVRAAEVPVLALEEPGCDAAARVREEIERAVQEDAAEAVLLGCAGMADLAARLTAEIGVPVLDGVGCAVKLAESLVALGLRTSKSGAYAYPRTKIYDGELARFAPQPQEDQDR
jgi:allantoin racemase